MLYLQNQFRKNVKDLLTKDNCARIHLNVDTRAGVSKTATVGQENAVKQERLLRVVVAKKEVIHPSALMVITVIT